MIRALRAAQQQARGEDGHPTFPELHARDEQGRPLPVPRASVHAQLPPHSRKPRLLAGESVDEVAFLFGHRNANVTGRTVTIAPSVPNDVDG